MASPVNDTYSAASGGAIYAGMAAPVVVPQFDAVTMVGADYAAPTPTADMVLVLNLHQSGGGIPGGALYTQGRQYRAAVSGLMAYDVYNEFAFGTLKNNTTSYFLRPTDYYGNYPAPFSANRRESMWFGFKDMPNGEMTLITRRRLDALMKDWAPKNLQYNPKKTCCMGGSMGGWGTMLYGLRRPDVFAALYPDRPRWLHNNKTGDPSVNVAVADWTKNLGTAPVGSTPSVRAEDGGGSLLSLMDHISYVQDTANRIPWIGWCVGWNDGYTPREDHVAAVAAMRAARRGFAFAWNNGYHGDTGPLVAQILASYPYGTFEIGRGYPLFENHSADGDPANDPTGGINIGLTFRNVVESATGWSCEVTSILGARTVDVSPISDVFKTAVAPKTVNISGAYDWQPVFF